MKWFACALFLLVIATPTLAGTSRIVSRPTMVCATEDAYDRVMDMIANKDWAAAARMLASGQCVKLNKGQKVYLETRSIIGGVVRVRPEGETWAGYTGMYNLRK